MDERFVHNCYISCNLVVYLTKSLYICTRKTKTTENYETNHGISTHTASFNRVPARPGTASLSGRHTESYTPSQRPAASAYARRESGTDDGPVAACRTPRHQALPMVERSPARRGTQRRGHHVPTSHRTGCHLRRPAGGTVFRHRQHRSTRQEPPGTRGKQRQHPSLPGTDLLDPQRQHLPRPTLGTRTGDLWRGSLPHLTYGCSRSKGPAGARRQQDACLRQALCRAQRTRMESPRLQC